MFILKNVQYTTKDAAFWKIVISLGMASLFIFATMYSIQPILPVFKESFDIPITYATLSMSLNTVGLIFGLLTIGFLSDRKGRVGFIKVSIFVTTVILFIIMLMPAFGVLCFLLLIQVFALAGAAGAALAYLSEQIHPTHFGFAATLYISCNSHGGMIGRFLMGFLAESYSWEIALFLLGAFGIITFLLVFFMLPQSRHLTGSTKPYIKDMKVFI